MIDVRPMMRAELPLVREFYASWSYGGEVRGDDTIFVAMDAARIVGVVRLVEEEGTWVLRGMRIAPEAQRQQIGTHLLDALVHTLGERACYCIPYAHLVGFYGQVRFRVLPETEAPRFLRERLAAYRARDDDRMYLIMYRPPYGRALAG